MDQKRQSGLSIILVVAGEFSLFSHDWSTSLFWAGRLILGAACEMLPHNSRELHASNATYRFINTKHLFADADIFN